MRPRDLEALIVVAGVALALAVLLALTAALLAAQARALRAVSPPNRRMDPGQVWLNFVPVFNLVWATVTVERVAESLRNEFRDRGLDGPDEDYGRRLGVLALVLLASGCLFYPIFVCYPIALVRLIQYWRHIERCSARLRSSDYAPPPVEEGW
jgi:hypothetical protein